MQVHRTRLTYLLASICLTFAGIILYLSTLQLVHMPLFLKLSQKNFQRHEPIPSARGIICDTHGIPLATNRPVYNAYWRGSLKKLEPMREQLERYIPLTLTKNGNRYLLAKDISFHQLSQLREQFGNHNNLIIDTTYERQYPQKDLACHVVGYLGLDQGKMGLEKIYQDALKGQTGKLLTIRDAVGQHIKAHQITPAYAGKTVYTTINAKLQRLAQRLFPKDAQGCLLLMDDDGALEVVLSYPTFDPSLFSKPLSATQWNELQTKQCFINRAINACYPPASLFKLVTYAAALETNIITPEMTWECTGSTAYKGRTYHCNKRIGHGTVSTEQALAHSCNIPFFEIGKHLPIDTLAAYAYRFGLGQKTGILFPERIGLVPTTTWKLETKKERWWPGETLSAAIGQSALLVTPLQVTTMIASLCTGTIIKPRIIRDEPISTEPLNLKPSTISFLNHCLSQVVQKGTGRQLKQLTDFTIKGKTGTAQVLSLDRKSSAQHHLSHGYFAGHFQYKNDKPRTLVILIEHAGYASIATGIAHAFFREYAQLSDRKAL